MEWSPSWEASSHFVNEEFTSVFGTRCLISVYKIPPLFSVLNHKQETRTSQTVSLRSILILFSQLQHLRRRLFPSGFPTKLMHVFHISPMSATWLANFFLLYLISLIIFYEVYNLRRSHYAILQPPPLNPSYLRILFPAPYFQTH